MKNTRSGFSITELLVATGLVSVVFLIGSSVITQLFSFQKDVDRRLMDSFSVVNFHRAMSRDLEGSYWARFGTFSCPSSASLMNTGTSASVTLSGKNGMVEFVTSDYSSSVGVLPGTSRISVATMRNLDKGNYVLLSLTSSGASAALFKVASVDRVSSIVTLESTTMDIPGTTCDFLAAGKSLNDFFREDAKGNVLLTRIKIVQYSITDGQLNRKILPDNVSDNVVAGVEQMQITSKWTSSAADNDDSKNIFGNMKFNATIDVAQATLGGIASKANEKQQIDAQYSLDSFQYLNRYSNVGAPNASMKFPTCAVAYGFRPGALKINPANTAYKNTVAVTVTGYSSESVDSSSIDISFSPAPGAVIYCFKHDPDGTNYTYPTVINSAGISGAISLTKPDVFDVYTCAVRGQVDLNASMTYFSTEINQVKTIPCSSDTIKAPTRYKFTDRKPSCSRGWGNIDTGSPIDSVDGTNISLGSLSVDMDKGCQWADQPDPVTPGDGSDCYPGNHTADLKKVFFQPHQLEVYDKTNSTLVFGAGGAALECN